MIIISAGNIKVNGLINGEDIIIKTSVVDKYFDQTVALLDYLAYTMSVYLKYKDANVKRIDVPPLILSDMSPIETTWSAELAGSWQLQNTTFKDVLISLGVPAEAIIICEDIDQDGNPVNIVQ